MKFKLKIRWNEMKWDVDEYLIIFILWWRTTGMRNENNEIVYSKLMKLNDEYVFSIKDNYTITTGNAGNLIVSVGGKIMGKLGKNGEVLESLVITLDHFQN